MAMVQGVAKSWTRLRPLTRSISFEIIIPVGPAQGGPVRRVTRPPWYLPSVA